MHVIATLLARKQAFIEELKKASGISELDRLQRQIRQVDTAIDRLDPPPAQNQTAPPRGH